MMNACAKCRKVCGVLFMALGILFLLQNLNIWNFWNIQWYTALFLLLGFGSVASCSCRDCQAMAKKR